MDAGKRAEYGGICANIEPDSLYGILRPFGLFGPSKRNVEEHFRKFMQLFALLNDNHFQFVKNHREVDFEIIVS